MRYETLLWKSLLVHVACRPNSRPPPAAGLGGGGGGEGAQAEHTAAKMMEQRTKGLRIMRRFSPTVSYAGRVPVLRDRHRLRWFTVHSSTTRRNSKSAQRKTECLGHLHKRSLQQYRRTAGGWAVGRDE